MKPQYIVVVAIPSQAIQGKYWMEGVESRRTAPKGDEPMVKVYSRLQTIGK
ncbi:MAG: hypothetical protein PSN44_06045 [Gammaproteobacteria bacterium]|nr:hypothetical protein [Gammaproteobacteria bacterium]